MNRGFTLLELIVVIVILGILSTLAATQYTKMVEKSRGAETRIILGSIRTNQAAMRLQNGVCSTVDADVGIGAPPGADFPSTCTGQTTHYFSYDLTGAALNVFTAVATRCTGTNGKQPGATAATVILTTNFDNGYDNWNATAPY